MKRFLNGLFNVCWVLFVGIWSAISSAITGIVNCLTILGIPFGLQHFKFIKLVFAPAGKVVVTRYGKHPVMNTFWLLFGGIVTGIIYWLLGIGLCITIIGIPLGKQLMKISKFNFAPFGCEVVKEGEYTSWGESAYDLKLLKRRILSNPDANVVDENGVSMTAREYIEQHKAQFIKGQKTTNLVFLVSALVGAVLGIVMGIILQRKFVVLNDISALRITAELILVILPAPYTSLSLIFLVSPIAMFIEKRLLKKTLICLRNCYPLGSFESKEWKRARITLNTIIKEFDLKEKQEDETKQEEMQG